MVKGFHKVDVHDGLFASFWFDKWLSLGRIHNISRRRGYIDFWNPIKHNGGSGCELPKYVT